MDRGAKAAGERAHRAAVRDPPGPPGEGNALGGNRHDGSSESLFGDALSSGVGAALHGGASQPAQCPSTAGSRTSPGRSPECAGGPQGDRRSHRELGRKPLGRAPGRSLRGTSRSAGRNRTATRWHALAALSRPLLASDALPERIAIGKSFRPTAPRICRSKPKTPREDQNQIPCGCQSPLEKALEEDISIWQKPGHFYFALTRICRAPLGFACGAYRVFMRTTTRGRYVSHLRCSEFLTPPFPALPGWATFFRASGAPVFSRSFWNLPVLS